MAIIVQMSVTGKSMNNDLIGLTCSPSKYERSPRSGWGVKMGASYVDLFCYLYLSLSYAMSVSCSLVVTCWERADLLVLLYVMLSCVFVTLRFGVLGQVWYLIVSISDLCLLSFIVY